MLVIGIDPGTATTGYGLLKVHENGETKLVSSGLIETDKDGDPSRRLDKIYTDMLSLLKEYSPDIFAMEKIFFFSNAKTVIRVGQAQGVLLLAAARAKIPVVEYAPGKIKLVVGGNGRADKVMMKEVVRKIFGIRAEKGKKTHFDNVADAIAVAMCHVMMVNPPSHKASAGKRG